MALTAFQRLKNSALPMGGRARRLPVGIGRGLVLDIDFRHQTKLYLGLYEFELNRYLKEFCRPGVHCFDIGADAGYDALLMAKLGARCVLSVDCSVDSIRRTAQNAKLNSSHHDVILTQVATIGAIEDKPSAKRTLDALSYGPDGFVPDVVKIDIEGAEFDALRGAHRLLSERRPHLIVETHEAAVEMNCIGLLTDLGFEPFIVNARGWIPDNRPADHNRWLVARGSPRTRFENGRKR